jgi:hypothetical protein
MAKWFIGYQSKSKAVITDYSVNTYLELEKKHKNLLKITANNTSQAEKIFLRYNPITA